MTFTFLKRERIVRQLPLSALLAVAVVASISSSFDQVRATFVEDLEREFLSVYGLLTFTTLQVVLICGAWSFPLPIRVNDFERSLPATMRQVVLERLGSIWLALFGTFLAAAATRFAMVPAADLGEHLRLLTRAFLASGVSAALIFAYRPARPEISTVEGGAVGLAGLAAWILSISGSSVGFDAGYLAALVGLLSFLWHALPAAPLNREEPAQVSSVEPTQSARAEAAPEGAGSASWPVRVFGPLRWTIIRSSLLRKQALSFGFLVVAFLCTLLVRGASPPGYILCLPAIGLMLMSRNVIYGLDSLPIRREKILRIACLSSLVFLVGSTAIFAMADRKLGSSRILAWGVEVDWCSEDVLSEETELRSHHVKVPAREWKMTTDPSDAVLTSPWGETVTPTLHPIYPGAKTVIYNPYDVQPDSSGALLVWQVQRALDQVHGPVTRMDDHFADWQDSVNKEEPLSDRFVDHADSATWGYDVVARSETANAVGFAALTAWLIWLVAWAFAFPANVPSSRAPAWWAKLPKGLVLLIIGLSVAIPLDILDRADPAILPVLAEQFHAWIDSRLGSSPALWTALVMALSGLSYAFMAWRIQRIEFLAPETNGLTGKALSIY